MEKIKFRVFPPAGHRLLVASWGPTTSAKAPMTKGILEGRVGGRCYSEQEDGTECDWGEVLLWEPPHRFVMAWKVTPHWGYEPDSAKSSEVEVKFTPMGDSTRVDLEHRYFERHGTGADVMRTSIDSPGGWGGLMELFRAQVEAA